MIGRQPRALLVLAAGLLLLAAASGVLAATRSQRAARSPARSGLEVVVTDTACAPGWRAPRSGRTVLTVRNTSRHSTYGVDLIGPDQVSVYADIETLAPGTSDSVDAVLPPGTYSFECESFAGGSLVSRPAVVSGPPVTGAHPYVPVTSDELRAATLRYRASIQPLLRRLGRDTDLLEQAVAAGRLADARRLWLPAHLDYEGLGVAYDTFGDLDGEINGRPQGLPGGVHDPDFRGFLRLEYGLWQRQPRAELTPVATRLDRAVHDLLHRFPELETDNTELPLRTHEILENTLQLTLTGEDDTGSGSGLATAEANVRGTQLALAALAPLLRRSSPQLTKNLTLGLAGLGAQLRAYRRTGESWRPLASLTRAERERLDGSLSGLLEQLELVPDRLELPRRPPSGEEQQRD